MAFRYHKFGIIISIDFGTTFSGTCYSATSKLSNKELRDKEYPDITVVTSWPQQSKAENKTPSINIYDRNFHLLHWGKAARHYIENGNLKVSQIAKEKFKLELPSSVPQKGAIYKTNNGKKMEHSNMRATIDYFRKIFDHTVSTIQKDIAVGPISIEKSEIRFIITVPAQWNDVQRAAMRTIAKEAGLITDEDHENRLLIINESFAATLYCEQKKTSLQNMEPGDKYIVCDAGGGTVNLVTFESVETVSGDSVDSFRRCQLTADSGDKCGSTFLDIKMRELLTRFCYNNVECKDKEEEKTREKLFSPVIDKFISDIKPVFGKRSREFKFPKCKHSKILKSHTELTFEANIDEGDRNDGQCIVCKVEDFRHMHKPNFGEDTIVVLRDALIIPHLTLYLPDSVKCERNGGICKFTIPYDIMRTQVFEEVTKRTLKLIDRQIKKANNNIKRTYLVGGFGSSPYLQKIILRTFYIKGTHFPSSQYRIGTLITDDKGDSAAMRGALMYGIDGSRRKHQTDVVEIEFDYAFTDKYNALICLDIGYLSTSCSYRDLGNKTEEMIEITDWPGLQKPNFMIPTAKETVNGETTWGAQVQQPIDPNYRKRITPSKLMSNAKAGLRRYLCEYIKLVLGHVRKSIAENNPQLSGNYEYRYVITMENCYQFFNSKSEMRDIAQLAGIISKEDPVERLLLIGRDTAAAMYIEKEYFSDIPTPTHTNHVLLINMYHDICRLSLMEHTKLSGKNIDVKDDQDAEIFRNVRSVRSATFDFDFNSRVVSYLNRYVSKNTCITCSGSHKVYTPTYYTELETGFLNYIKTTLDLDNSDETQNIPITNAGCCIASIKVYDILEYVFLPAIKDLALEINRFVIQTNMIQRFNLDKVLLSGTFVETSTPNYKFLESILLNNISKFMNISTDYISLSRHNGREALLGAAIYGNDPKKFTERVARTSYAVNVCAYGLGEFEGIEKNYVERQIKESKDKKDLKNIIYDVECTYGHANNEKIDLFYQSLHNPSLYTSAFDRKDNDLTYFVRQGDKILERDEYEGILKKFYTYEDCIVYATIYSSDTDDLLTEEIKTDNRNFRKIHRFELYVKRDEDSPMTVGDKPRLHFDIRLTFDNTEAKFEATVSSGLGKVFEYRFKDELLVANIYDDRQFIEIGNLTIDEVGDLTIDEVGNLTTNEADDLTTNEVDDLTTNKVDDLTTNEADDLTTNEVDKPTTAEIDDEDISEVDDLPVIEVTDLTIDTPSENMSDNTIVRKKSRHRLFSYFNKYFR